MANLVAMTIAVRSRPLRDSSENFFTALPAIDIGGVEKIDALIERRMHDLRTRFRIAAHAEVVAADTRHRDLESGGAEISVFHARVPA